MDDKELADRIVALGVGIESPGVAFMRYRVIGMLETDAESFVRDWRVAWELMEMVRQSANKDALIRFTEPYSAHKHQVTIYSHFGSNDLPRYTASNESLPRAINEACVEALSDD